MQAFAVRQDPQHQEVEQTLKRVFSLTPRHLCEVVAREADRWRHSSLTPIVARARAHTSPISALSSNPLRSAVARHKRHVTCPRTVSKTLAPPPAALPHLSSFSRRRRTRDNRPQVLIYEWCAEWRRGWDSKPHSAFRICQLQRARCHDCHVCQQCRRALPAIGRWRSPPV